MGENGGGSELGRLGSNLRLGFAAAKRVAYVGLALIKLARPTPITPASLFAAAIKRELAACNFPAINSRFDGELKKIVYFSRLACAQDYRFLRPDGLEKFHPSNR